MNSKLLENWLNDWLGNSEKLPPEYKSSLEKWYRGDNAIKNLTFPKVEAFEIAEFGHQPSDEEIRRLFPILNS